MKKVLKIIFKEIGRFLGVVAIPTFGLYVGLLGQKGIDFSSRLRADNTENFIFIAITLYFFGIVITIYGLYHEYYLPYKKRKEQQPKESTPTQEEIKSTAQTTVNEDKKSTYWQKVVSPCKNIMTVVIVLLLIRFITPQESWFLNIVFLGVFGYWLRCMHNAKKKTKDIG
jgi:hypothetical protein